jgi:hypothetical protein
MPFFPVSHEEVLHDEGPSDVKTFPLSSRPKHGFGPDRKPRWIGSDLGAGLKQKGWLPDMHPGMNVEICSLFLSLSGIPKVTFLFVCMRLLRVNHSLGV